MYETRHGFTLWKRKGVRFFTIPSFRQAGGITCAMSTRIGGVSAPPYNTLNFSQKREQNRQNFEQNFKNFGESAGFDYKKAIANNYEHGSTLFFAGKEDAGAGVVSENLDIHCDGLYTDEKDLPLITYHADCVPLFFYDPIRKAAAICHAGWKGVSMHIIKNAINSLADLGCNRENILTAIGPCISVNYFEVQQDVSSVFKETFGDTVIEIREEKTYVDLPKACVIDMQESGIVASNITMSDLCTYEHERFFFSHRRDNGNTGAMAAVIKLDK